MSINGNNIQTKLIHGGRPGPRIDGSVVMPIFQTAMFEYDEEADQPVRYIRYGNTPNHLSLAAKLAALENAQDAVVTASGLPAVFLTGFAGITVYHLALNRAELTITAGAASMLGNTVPIFTCLLGRNGEVATGNSADPHTRLARFVCRNEKNHTAVNRRSNRSL